jgi:hypothetical protein
LLLSGGEQQRLAMARVLLRRSVKSMPYSGFFQGWVYGKSIENRIKNAWFTMENPQGWLVYHGKNP